jgi:hypothetical protein
LEGGTGEHASVGAAGPIAVGDQSLTSSRKLAKRHEQIEVAEFTQTRFAIGEGGEGRTLEGDHSYLLE